MTRDHDSAQKLLHCSEVIEDWGLGLGFCIGNAIKHILRAEHKQDSLEDLRKAEWYLARALQNGYCFLKPGSKCSPEEVGWAWALPEKLQNALEHLAQGSLIGALAQLGQCIEERERYITDCVRCGQRSEGHLCSKCCGEIVEQNAASKLCWGLAILQAYDSNIGVECRAGTLNANLYQDTPLLGSADFVVLEKLGWSWNDLFDVFYFPLPANVLGDDL